MLDNIDKSGLTEEQIQKIKKKEDKEKKKREKKKAFIDLLTQNIDDNILNDIDIVYEETTR